MYVRLMLFVSWLILLQQTLENKLRTITHNSAATIDTSAKLQSAVSDI